MIESVKAITNFLDCKPYYTDLLVKVKSDIINYWMLSGGLIILTSVFRLGVDIPDVCIVIYTVYILLNAWYTKDEYILPRSFWDFM